MSKIFLAQVNHWNFVEITRKNIIKKYQLYLINDSKNHKKRKFNFTIKYFYSQELKCLKKRNYFFQNFRTHLEIPRRNSRKSGMNVKHKNDFYLNSQHPFRQAFSYLYELSQQLSICSVYYVFMIHRKIKGKKICQKSKLTTFFVSLIFFFYLQINLLYSHSEQHRQSGSSEWLRFIIINTRYNIISVLPTKYLILICHFVCMEILEWIQTSRIC